MQRSLTSLRRDKTVPQYTAQFIAQAMTKTFCRY